MKRIIGLLALLLLLCPQIFGKTWYIRSPHNPSGNYSGVWVGADSRDHATDLNGLIADGDWIIFSSGVHDSVQMVPARGGVYSQQTVWACSTWLVDGSDAGRNNTFVRGSSPASVTWTQVGSTPIWTTTFNSPETGEGAREYIALFRDNIQCWPRMGVNAVLDGSDTTQSGCDEDNEYAYNTTSNVISLRTSTNPNSSSYRFAWRPIMKLNYEDQSNVLIFGLTLEETSVKMLSFGEWDTSPPKPGLIEVRNCNLRKGTTVEQSNNGALIYSGRGGNPMALGEWTQFITVVQCSLSQVKTVNDGLHGGAGIEFYFTRDGTIDSNVFGPGLTEGIALKMGCYPDNGIKSLNWNIRHNVFNGCWLDALWIGNKVGNVNFFGNTVAGSSYGIDLHTSDPCGFDPTQGNILVQNNTFFNCDQAIALSEGNAIGGNKIKYNIFADWLPAIYVNPPLAVGFRHKGGEQGAETPSTESYWRTGGVVGIDSNWYYYTGSGGSFVGSFSANSGYTPVGDCNWAQWSAVFDLRSTNGTNPNFTDAENGNFARPSANPATEMGTSGITYDGKVWKLFGAWQPETPAHSPKWHDIGQTWHDNYGGLVNAANGFASGDTLNLIENIFCRNKKWGFIIQTPVIILGNGYKIAPDSVALNNIANNSFETPDTDPTRAANWDFTDAPAITRRAGHYEVVLEGSDEPSLWDGSYALRVQLPCTTQTVKSAAFYNFAPKTHHAIEMAYLNTANTNVRVTVGLLTAGGDTAYSAMNNTGTMERGSEPIWVHFMTGDAVESYKIFVQITGGSTAASSDQIYFDHVLHTTFRTFGIALEPDTCSLVIDMMNSQRYYVASGDSMAVEGGLCYGSAASNREFWGLGVAGGVGEGTIIKDLRIEPVQPSLFSVGIYGSYTCSDVTIKKATIFPKGSNPNGVFTWNAIRWNVDSTDITFPDNPLSFHYTKREAVPSVGINLRADKNSYGYSSRISYCRVYNYAYQGVYLTTRRDTSADGILQYPLNIVEYCEFYPKTTQTNGFAIEDYGNAPSIIRNNKVFGTGQYHGTGIHITTKTVDPDSMQWSIVEGNVVAVESYPYSQEYGYGNLAYGIQLEGVPICSLRNNYTTALAINPSAPAVDGLRITRSGSFKWVMHDNTFRGFSTGAVTGSALQFYYPSWSFTAGADRLEMRHNNFITNGLWLRGVGVNSVGLEFRDNFFDYQDTLTAPNWRKAKNGENAYLSSRELRFIDNRYGDAEADSAFEQRQMFGSYNSLTTANDGTEWFVSWTATINSRDETAAPLSGTTVEIRNALDSLVYSGITGVSGQLITIVDEFRDSAKTTVYNQNSDRTLYNPHTITVTHNFVEQQQQFTITQPTTLNFTFQSGEEQGGRLRKKKKLID